MKLHTKILLGLVLGAVAGIAVNRLAGEAAWVAWVSGNVAGPVGQVFLRMLLMTVVPLVFASVVLGVASLGDLRTAGRVGGRTLAWFLASTAISGALGLLLVNVFKPGVGLDPAVTQRLMETYQTDVAGLQARAETGFGVAMFLNIVPRNPLDAAVRMDMLAVIFFAIVFGAALAIIPGERARPMIDVLEALGDIMMKIIGFAMKLAPYGVFCLIFVVTAKLGLDILQRLGAYVLIVLVGLLLHAGVVLSLMVRFFGGISPLLFWRKARASVVTAFSTSSSNATLPTNIAVAEQELGIPPRIAGFVLPLGATMNMNGTSLYEGVTVLFLAQVFGIELSLGSQAVVLLLAVLTAVGAAGVPGGSLPLIMTVLATVGVPPESIAIILGVDRVLDMARTTVNVTGDLAAATWVARTEAGWRPPA